jgi:hypothetical protein
MSPVPRQDVAVLHVELALEDARVGLVADRDETAFDRELDRAALLRTLQSHAGNT